MLKRRHQIYQYAIVLQPKVVNDEIAEEGKIILAPQNIYAMNTWINLTASRSRCALFDWHWMEGYQ